MTQPMDQEIVRDFREESQALIDQLIQILEDCEGNPGQVKGLETYGQTVDRIMGGAQSLAVQAHQSNVLIRQIGDYAAVCKAVGYKASQIQNNDEFYDVCVAFLLDATDVLREMVVRVDGDSKATAQGKQNELRDFISSTFIERLKWLSNKFGKEFRSTVDFKKGENAKQMSQDDIDSLMKKLGL